MAAAAVPWIISGLGGLVAGGSAIKQHKEGKAQKREVEQQAKDVEMRERSRLASDIERQRTEASQTEAEARRRASALSLSGRTQGTLLTGSRGLGAAPATERKTLLGL